ncbi:MAG: SDR family oxidoreductase [Hyphomicrobiaceae bacterium]|nr:SDR family oxidoreductase [Hyphomicrobiaceae bacterium]
MSHLLCFGLGYSARAIAARLHEQGWRISGTARSSDSAARIARMGYEGLVFDGSIPSDAVRDALGAATHLLVSIPAGETGDPALACHMGDIARAEGLAWIGYLSTVGVYGDRQGAWVDEDSPPRPTSDRSRRRLDAERAWLALGERCGKRVQVFRLAGIYGPGRSAFDALRAGRARRIVQPGQVFNRIHVEDVARVVAAAAASPGRHSVYNVADDEPAPPQDVIAFAAGLLGLPLPPEVSLADAGLGPMAASFYAESKRVGNRRIKEDLGIQLAFPTYREGLLDLAGR